MNFLYFDIESLENVFTCVTHNEKNDTLDIYYLIDPYLYNKTTKPYTLPQEMAMKGDSQWQKECEEYILNTNKNFTNLQNDKNLIQFFDLHQKSSREHLFQTFGLSTARYMNQKNKLDSINHLEDVYEDKYRLICDTDIEEYNPDEHPYILGYNSENYDITMLSIYGCSVQPSLNQYQPQYNTAHNMRYHNDMLFSSEFKNNMPKYLMSSYMNSLCGLKTQNNISPKYYQTNLIRKNMLMSGRYIDIARLNEKQSKVALKRLLGMLGFQIKESSKLTSNQTIIYTLEELYDLIAYNVSDVVNEKALFHHRVYYGQFELKRGQLQEYPELIYKEKGNSYKPDISPNSVREDRLWISSSSAQFATKVLCPYGHITDIPTVSFMYPHPEQAAKLGITPVNVLEESKKFFYDKFGNYPDVLKRFDNIYNFYKQIEGKNYNDSQTYIQDNTTLVTRPTELNNNYYTERVINCQDGSQIPYTVNDLSKIPPSDTFLPYFDKDGNETSCYVIFSTGGIHGAEYNKELYDFDRMVYQLEFNDLNEAKKQFGSDQAGAVALRKARKIIMPDGRELSYKLFLKGGKKIPDSEWKILKEPVLYEIKKDKKLPKLKDRYTFTSAALCNHEDFKSYYPNLLRMMMAFYNKGLGYDRYAEIFYQKEDYGKLMKDNTKTKQERNFFSILRDGTKLILNSASGAADAKFINNIRANNQIISMRIIGQLFSWRIGQAQTYEGARLISTNTDGLYSEMEETKNNEILDKESKNINVLIEPEPLYLISKDTNNRLELNSKDRIQSASGGTLGCRLGPDPTKSLNHPAIIDWAVSEYLIVASRNYKGISLSEPFNNEIGLSILKSACTKFDKINYLIMMQNIVASSPGSNSYVFGLPTDVSQDIISGACNIFDFQNHVQLLQHYNRAFILKDDTPNSIHLYMGTVRKLTPAQKVKRQRDNQVINENLQARYVLNQNGVNNIDYANEEYSIKKISGIEQTWNMFIYNSSLYRMPENDYNFIIENLDLKKYLILMENTFENSWRNHKPGDIFDNTSSEE